MNKMIWYLVASSDAVSKLVLLILGLLSVACWALFFYKLVMLSRRKIQIKQMSDALAKTSSLDDIISLSRRMQTTYGGALMAHHLSDFKRISQSVNARGGQALDWSALQEQMYQTVDSSLESEQTIFAVLSTSAQISPLLGLFGTVWGLIHAFVNISQARSADIVAVAPGIAEALVTTLAGLCVAIPALVLFHILRNRLFLLAQALTELTDGCYWHLRTVSLPVRPVEVKESSLPFMPPDNRSSQEKREESI